MSQEIKTICRDCIWATWDGDQQEDCKLDRLDKLEQNGARLVPEESNGKLYLAILDRFCNACHNEESFRDVPRRKRREHLDNLIGIKVEVLIIAEAGTAFADVGDTINNIRALNHAPKVITLVTPDTELALDTAGIFRESDFAWRVVVTQQECVTYDYDSLVTEGARESKQTYILALRAGASLDAEYLTNVNKAINIQMLRFVALRPEPLFAQTALFNTLKGNVGMPFIDKLQGIAEENKQEHVIMGYNELCELV